MKEMKEGKMIVKEYKCFNRIIYIGDYLDEKNMEMEKNIFVIFNYFLMVNF